MSFRILHTVHSLDNKLGGAVHTPLNICRELSALGYEHQILTTRGGGDDLDYLSRDYEGVSCHFLPRHAPQRWYNSRELDPWLDANLRRFGVADIHSIFSFVTVKTAKYCRAKGVPYVVRSHGSLDPFDLRKRALLKKLVNPIFVRPVLAGAAAVVCASQREADDLVTYGANPRRFVVPLPVPERSFDRNERNAFRARHGIPPDATVVLFLSRVDYKKGLEFLIPSLAEAKRRRPDLWFLMVGSGDTGYVAGIHRLLEETGVARWATVPGFLSGKEKAAAFVSSDLFALPSMNENFGIVVVEAMQAGLPILISDQVYIHPEIGQNGAGWVCEASTAGCTRALAQALGAGVDLGAVGAQARATATARFGPRNSALALIEVYKQVMGGSKT